MYLLSAILLNNDSGTDGFLPILQNFQNSFWQESLREIGNKKDKEVVQEIQVVQRQI